MSNPAVIELIDGCMSIGKYRIEDNIGESIHLHIGDWRFDLTIEELNELARNSGIALNNFLSIDGFDYIDFDPLFLSQIASYLPDLIEVRDEKIKLSELLVDTRVCGFIRYRGIDKSRVYKAYLGNAKEDERYKQINKHGETNSDRRDTLLESIKNNGYPYNNNYIILFNDQNIVRDGQHRAAALYYLNGDIEIPIKRMIFIDNKHNVSWKNYVKRFRIKKVLSATKKLAKRLLKLHKKIQKEIFLLKYKNRIRNLV